MSVLEAGRRLDNSAELDEPVELDLTEDGLAVKLLLIETDENSELFDARDVEPVMLDNADPEVEEFMAIEFELAVDITEESRLVLMPGVAVMLTVTEVRVELAPKLLEDASVDGDDLRDAKLEDEATPAVTAILKLYICKKFPAPQN